MDLRSALAKKYPALGTMAKELDQEYLRKLQKEVTRSRRSNQDFDVTEDSGMTTEEMRAAEDWNCEG